MSVTINRTSPKGDLLPPHEAEGREPYALAVVTSQVPDRVIWADTYAEVVSCLSRHGDDYLAETDESVRLSQRAEWMLGTQVQLQAFINASAQENGDWMTLTAWEIAVLNGRRTLEDQPSNFPTRHIFGLDLWGARVPLVSLVGTGHPVPVVVSDCNSLIVVDATTDETSVRSLSSAGYLHLWTVTPSEDIQ